MRGCLSRAESIAMTFWGTAIRPRIFRSARGIDCATNGAAALAGASTRVCLVVALMGFLLVGPALAQLSKEDIEALRKQGEAEGWTFTVGENDATRRPLSELCGLIEPIGWEEGTRPGPPGPRRDLPASFDWRDHSGCTPIRNQDGCGSCWAFAAIGTIESAILINDGLSTDLSEQWLISCTSAGSCSGGWHTSAYGFLCCQASWRDPCGDCGPVLESDFPYVAWDAPCNCPYPHPYRIDDWARIGSGIPPVDDIKQAILDYGPVSATVHVNSPFQAYSGGVFNACWDGQVNHAIVLVGWDDNQGPDGVWFLRNSWGTSWGEYGYMRIPYGCSRVGGAASYIEYRYDCNANGIRDDYDIADCDGSAWCGDCNNNDVPDVCDIDDGTSEDCNQNGVPDECDLSGGTSEDCNQNGVPDECDLANGSSRDCNENGVPDECDFAGLDRFYVDPDATGDNDGSTWSDAMTDLQTALCMARSAPEGMEIWVAAGTYRPTEPGGERSATFRLVSGVALRGGFAGTEMSLEQRDLSNPDNRSILSGDLNGDDQPGFVNNDENSYHVVRGSGADATAVLDGFTIIGGNADGPSPDDSGGGLYNYMGSPAVINCIFVGNYASHIGGAMCNQWEWDGIGGSCPVVINSVCSGNHAGVRAGAIANLGTVLGDASPTLLNCSIVGNSAPLVGGMYTEGTGAPTLANCILWGNSDNGLETEQAQIAGESVVNYCCIEGLSGDLGGAGNTGDPPFFADIDGPDNIPGTLDDNVRLMPCSAGIDAGDNSSVPPDVATDLDGNPRFVDDPGTPDSGNPPDGQPIVDMGAYEFQGSSCFGDLDGDSDIDLSDLSILLANYGMTSGASYASGDLDGDEDVDLADLAALLGIYGTICP
jgi:hypothetical protein